MNFNIYHVCINQFHQIYDDLIAALRGSLIDLGHTCTVTKNQFVPGSVNILVGSTIFASKYDRLREKLAGKPYIVYQLEQLDDHVGLLPEWSEYWSLLRNATAIWDYSPAGVDYLRSKGMENVFHLPPGFHRDLETFRPCDKPDIDVLFIGSSHPRRDKITADLRGRGLKTVALSRAFAEVRTRHLSRARIVLNIHAWDDIRPLETVRLSYLLANRVFVISESADHNPYGGGVVYAPYDKLADACAHYAREPDAVRSRIAMEGYFAVRRIDLADLLRRLIEESNAATARAPTEAEGGVGYFNRSRQGMLEYVPTTARRVLDIGCGEGAFGGVLKRRQPCDVTGVEIWPPAAVKAARTLDTALCGNAFDILPTLPDEDFDCVTMLDVLEHVDDSIGLLKLAARKLKPDGRLIVSVPNVAHWSIIEGLMAGRWDYADEGILDRTHRRFFTLHSLKELFLDAGLRMVHLASTTLKGRTPDPGILETARRIAPRRRQIEANLHAYQYICVLEHHLAHTEAPRAARALETSDRALQPAE